MNDDGLSSSELNPKGQAPAKRFPTVGIGTSAGGVRALQSFFESLPGPRRRRVRRRRPPRPRASERTARASSRRAPGCRSRRSPAASARAEARLRHSAQPTASRHRSASGDRRIRRAALAAGADRSLLPLARRAAGRRFRHHPLRRRIGRLGRHQGGQGGRRHHSGAGPGRGRIRLDAAQRHCDRPRRPRPAGPRDRRPAAGAHPPTATSVAVGAG